VAATASLIEAAEAETAYIDMQNPDMEHWTLKFDQRINIFT
jgi:hypothetical protein